jgi:DNA polymerase III alpha subunit
MTYDKFGNAIYQETDLIELIYSGKEQFLEQVLVEPNLNIEKFESNSGITLNKLDSSIYELELADFDSICQNDWFIPDEYRNMDIETFIVQHSPTEHHNRILEELNAYKERDLLILLKTLKYLVDTFRKNDIVWGVGRGSSVASYVLFILGVHRIDSIKYNLNWQDFLR